HLQRATTILHNSRILQQGSSLTYDFHSDKRDARPAKPAASSRRPSRAKHAAQERRLIAIVGWSTRPRASPCSFAATARLNQGSAASNCPVLDRQTPTSCRLRPRLF